MPVSVRWSAPSRWTRRRRTLGPMNETRWTEKRGRQVVGQWRRSGRSMAAFARERDFSPQRLRYWRDRLEPTAAADEPGGGRLVPGVVVEFGGPSVTLQLPRGVVVEAKAAREVEPGWVAELVRALEEAT